MTSIVVLGGTGYAGSAIVAEAIGRGHEVSSFSRSLPENRLSGVTYQLGSATDTQALASAIKGREVVILSLSPRGELAGKLVETYRAAFDAVRAQGSRVIVVGGFSSLRAEAGAPRFADTDQVPAEFADEAREVAAVLAELEAGRAAGDELDWTFATPAAAFGSFAPGEALGRYRIGTDIAVFDENGESAISGADFALAVVDLVHSGEHRREQVSFAY